VLKNFFKCAIQKPQERKRTSSSSLTNDAQLNQSQHSDIRPVGKGQKMNWKKLKQIDCEWCRGEGTQGQDGYEKTEKPTKTITEERQKRLSGRNLECLGY